MEEGDIAVHGHEVYPSDVPSLGYPSGVPRTDAGASAGAARAQRRTRVNLDRATAARPAASSAAALVAARPRTRSVLTIATAILAGRRPEHVEHRRHGGHHRGSARRRGQHPATGSSRVQRADHDVVAHARERELGDQGDADAGGDQALDGLVVVALEGDARLEARARGRSGRRGGRRGWSAEVCTHDSPAQVLEARRSRLRRAGGRAGSARRMRVLEQSKRAQARARASRRRPGTRRAGRGRTRRRAGAARSPPARPRRGSARRRGARRGRPRSRAASGWRPAVGNEAIRSRPPRTAGDRGDLRLGGLELGEDAVGVLGQRGAGGGRADAAPVALDQRDAGLGLERGDRLRDGRLRVGERVGGAPRRSPLAATSRSTLRRCTFSISTANLEDQRSSLC